MYFQSQQKALLPGAFRSQYRAADEAEKQLYLFSPIMLLGFIVCNTFIAWDFAMMLIPHWHSTVFPIHYWFGNVFAGSAAMIAIAVVMRRVDGGGHFGPYQIKSLGMLVTGFTLLWLYFFWAQFFVIWFGNLPHESEPIWRQMYGHYSIFFWTMITGCFFLPFVTLLFAIVKRSVLAMCIVAFAINLGIWRAMMLIPHWHSTVFPIHYWFGNVFAGSAAMIAEARGNHVLAVYWRFPYRSCKLYLRSEQRRYAAGFRAVYCFVSISLRR